MSDPSKPPPRNQETWRNWTFIAAALVLAFVVLQNSQDVRVKIFLAEFTAPLILLLLITAALGAVVGYAAPVLRRHHRERHRP